MFAIIGKRFHRKDGLTLDELNSGVVQESPIYLRVEGRILDQNPLSVNTVTFSFSPLYYLIHFSHSFFDILKVLKKTVNLRK